MSSWRNAECIDCGAWFGYRRDQVEVSRATGRKSVQAPMRCPPCRGLFRGSPVSMWAKRKARDEFEMVCYICEDVATELDHVQPKSKGGIALAPICFPCNNTKRNQDLEESGMYSGTIWLTNRGRIIQVQHRFINLDTGGYEKWQELPVTPATRASAKEAVR